MLYCITYAFLLRCRSEALPLCSGGVPERLLPRGVHPAMVADDESVSLRLASRKNRPEGSLLTRSCWCKACRITCPVHSFGSWWQRQPAGTRPFEGVKGGVALRELRRRLLVLGVPEAERHCLHDFRRGHAEDLRASGAPLITILKAGEWRSPAFLLYLDSKEVEADAVLAAQLDSESDED